MQAWWRRVSGVRRRRLEVTLPSILGRIQKYLAGALAQRSPCDLALTLNVRRIIQRAGTHHVLHLADGYCTEAFEATSDGAGNSSDRIRKADIEMNVTHLCRGGILHRLRPRPIHPVASEPVSYHHTVRSNSPYWWLDRSGTWTVYRSQVFVVCPPGTLSSVSV
jgi:hypothetical protein